MRTRNDPKDRDIASGIDAAELRDHEDGKKCTASARKLIGNVHQRVHATQFKVITAGNVLRNNTTSTVNKAMRE